MKTSEEKAWNELRLGIKRWCEANLSQEQKNQIAAACAIPWDILMFTGDIDGVPRFHVGDRVKLPDGRAITVAGVLGDMVTVVGGAVYSASELELCE